MKYFSIRRVQRRDALCCSELEQRCFVSAEAAPAELIRKRIEVYPDGFYVAECDGRIVGMINTGATHKDDITDKELRYLSGHVRNGKNGVVFSLAVDPAYRRLGIASALVNTIISVLEQKEKQKIVLLCKEELVDFFSNLGFTFVGRADTDFAGCSWYQMSFSLPLPAWMITSHHTPASIALQ